MIGIITETRYSEAEASNLIKQGCKINYLMLPQFYSNYNDAIAKANSKLVYTASALIVKIDKCYLSTKNAIEQALYKNKQVRIIWDGKTFDLSSMQDWHVAGDRHHKSYDHPVLQFYKNNMAEYHIRTRAEKQKEQLEVLVSGISEAEDEVLRFVRTFAPLYEVDVDLDDTREVVLAYQSLKFYLDHDFPYSKPPQDVVVYIGNEEYLEDFFYHNNQRA